jgi:hypothetical protein
MLTAVGRKTIELRSWKVTYRGPLLICVSKKADVLTEASKTLILQGALAFWPGFHKWEDLYVHAGFAICIVELVDCRPMERRDEAAACRPFNPDLFSWVTEPVQRRTIVRFPVKGYQGLFEVVTGLV